MWYSRRCGGENPTPVPLSALPTRTPRAGSVTAMIELRGLTKRYGRTTAVADLTFTVRPGIVTGCLGPTGAGTPPPMRMILGLDRPTNGSVTVNGRRYAESKNPMRELGACSIPARCTRAAAPGLPAHVGRRAYGPVPSHHLLHVG